MNLLKFSTLIVILLLSNSLMAQVWTATTEWSEEWEQKFSDWVKSDSVQTDIFHSQSSKYHGIKVDCADATYALRVVFAAENSLPFQVKNPMYRPGKPKYYTNESSHSSWDNLTSETERIVKFVNKLGGFLGTETLSVNDSYPLVLSSIRSGDFFLYKIKKSSGVVRHSYNIKDITRFGLFDLIYSTQERAKNNKPMALTKNQKLSHMPTLNHWGFKRFIRPDFFEADISQAIDYSREQYDLVNSVGMTESKFFKIVQDLLKQNDESINQQATRLINDLCDKAQDRVSVVTGAIDYLEKTNNRCMNYTDYDTFSTPNRDLGLKESFKALLEVALTVKDKQLENDLDENIVMLLEIFANKDIDEDSKSNILSFCPIVYKEGVTPLNLHTFYWALLDNKVSSHPNDDLNRRWGLSSSIPKTKCKAFY